MDRDLLERAVGGALRSTINDHGPISPTHIGSAVKRVLGALQNVQRESDDVPRAISRPHHAAGVEVPHSWDDPVEMLTDEQADEIREQLDSGVMGPILKKWLRQLLVDRELRVLQEVKLVHALDQADEELQRERGDQ